MMDAGDEGNVGEVGEGGTTTVESGRPSLLIDLLDLERDPATVFGERAGFSPSNASISSAASLGESVFGLIPA